jgi:hypothetical protein
VSWQRHIGCKAQRTETIVPASFNWKSFEPVAVESFPRVGANNQRWLSASFGRGFELKGWANFLARRCAAPALGVIGLGFRRRGVLAREKEQEHEGSCRNDEWRMTSDEIRNVEHKSAYFEGSNLGKE